MKEYICIVCPKGCHLEVDEKSLEVKGNTCPRGEAYGRAELTNPTRVVTSTVRLKSQGHDRLPVKTDRPIPKPLILEAARLLNGVEVKAPIKAGEPVLENILGTGASFVASRTVSK